MLKVRNELVQLNSNRKQSSIYRFLFLTFYGLFLMLHSSLTSTWIYCTILVQVIYLLQKTRRFLLVPILPLNLYACGPFLAFEILGINRYPYPSEEILLKLTALQLKSVYIVFLLCVLFGLDQRFKTLIAGVNEDSYNRGTSLLFPFFLGMIGSYNFLSHFDLIRNFSNLQRHEIFVVLNFVNGPLGIAFGQVASLTAAKIVIGSGHFLKRMYAIFALTIYWMPILLSGSRQYFFIFAIGVLILFYQVRAIKTIQMFFLFTLTSLFLFLVPILFGYAANLSLNEYIFPSQYNIQIFTKNLTPESLDVASVSNSWIFLLPSFLRQTQLNSWTEVIRSLSPLQIGVGGSPWVEWFNNNFLIWTLSSALSIFFLIYLIASSKGLNQIARISLFTFTIVLGRTFFWNSIVILIGIYLFARINMKFSRDLENFAVKKDV